MKDLKTRLTRLLAVFASLVLLVSMCAIPISASTPGSNPILSGPNPFGITYENGIYTVTIDAERLAEVLSSKSFDKTTLTEIMPEPVYNLLKNRDAASAIALLKELYASMSIKDFKSDFPMEVFGDLLSKDHLLEFIDFDKLKDVIDISELVRSLSEDELLQIIKADKMDALLSLPAVHALFTPARMKEISQRLTPAQINAALKAGAINRLVSSGAIDPNGFVNATVVKKLYNEGLLTDADLSLLIDSDTVTAILNDSYLYSQIFNNSTLMTQLLSDSVIMNKLLGNASVMEELYNAGCLDALISNTVIENILKNETGLLNAIVTDSFVDHVLDDALIDELIDAGVLETMFTREDLINLLSAEDKNNILASGKDPATMSLREIIGPYVTIAEMKAAGLITAEKMRAVPVSILKNHVSFDMIHTATDDFAGLVKRNVDLSSLDLSALFTSGTVNKDVIANAVKSLPGISQDIFNAIPDKGALLDAVDVNYLLSSGIISASTIVSSVTLDIEKVLEKNIINLSDVINSISDMNALVAEINTPALPISEILAVIPASDFVNALSSSGQMKDLLQAVDFNYALKLPAVQAAIRNLSFSKVLDAIDIQKIKTDYIPDLINVTLGNVEYATLNGETLYCNYKVDVTAVERAILCALPSFDKLANLGSDGIISSLVLEMSVRGTPYTFGFQIRFSGNTEKLKEYAQKITDIVSFNVEADGTINFNLNANDKLIEMYLKALDSDKLPASVREILQDFPNYPINKDSLNQVIDKLIRVLTVDELRSILEAVDLNSLDDFLLKQLNMHESQAKVLLSYTIKSLEIVKRAESIPDAIRTLVQKLKDKLLDKTRATPGTRTYAPARSPAASTFSDFYVGNGKFVVDKSFAFDVLAGIEEFISIPDTVKSYFDNTLLKHTIHLNIDLKNLREVKYVSNGTTVFTAYLPEGADLSKVTSNAAFAALGSDNWATADATVVTTMPAEDIVLAKLHKANIIIDGTVHSTVYFTEETSSISLPSSLREHYRLVWDPYTLGNTDIDITGTYTPIDYTVTFEIDGVTQTITYNIETKDSARFPVIPARKGYSAAWDCDTLPLENKTIRAIYTPITYYITFVDKSGNEVKVPFNVETSSIVPPAVPDLGVGYKNVKWADYTLVDDAVYAATGSYNQTVRLSYDLIHYTLTFVTKNGTKIKEIDVTMETTTIDKPAVPDERGYKNGKWETYTLGSTPNITVKPVYDLISYYLTFVDKAGATIQKIEFNVETTSIVEPSVPDLGAGYENVRWVYTLLDDAVFEATLSYDQTIRPSYDLTTYYITFVDSNGNQIGEKIPYTVEDKDISSLPIPALAPRKGYTNGRWETFSLGTDNITVKPLYDPITYYLTFKDKLGNQVGSKIPFTVETDPSTVIAPTAPELSGYNVSWPDFTVLNESVYEKTGSYDQEITAYYEPISYTATFMVDGKPYKTIQFTVETASLEEPEIPLKEGYSAAWSAYTLELKNLTIDAVYTLINYKVTFVADGKVVAEVLYNVENRNITAPEVPAKEGYTGAWEAYSLTTGDITVSAIYTQKAASSTIFWWIMIGILLLALLIALLVFWLLTKNKNNNTPGPKAPEPEILPAPKPAPAQPARTVPQHVDSVAAEEVDDLMTDTEAAEALTISEEELGGTGKKMFINLGRINEMYEAGATVELASLKEKGLISSQAGRVKILADGTLDKPLTVKADDFSAQAIKMIVLTGGEAIRLKERTSNESFPS